MFLIIGVKNSEMTATSSQRVQSCAHASPPCTREEHIDASICAELCGGPHPLSLSVKDTEEKTAPPNDEELISFELRLVDEDNQVTSLSAEVGGQRRCIHICNISDEKCGVWNGAEFMSLLVQNFTRD